jgi:predicted transcriptional regulator
VGYVKVSPIRTKTLISLENSMKMPTEIAKDTNLRITQVSNALSDLKRKNLVICLNENMTKGRIYISTDFGKKVLEYIK